MKRHSRLDRLTAKRAKLLGNVGERIASRVLAESGFKKIRNLNGEMPNFPFADFYAERDGHRYAISVKIRNKFEATGRLNSRYKLGANCDRLAKLAEKKLDAEAAWLAIALEPRRFSAYFGLLVQLGHNRGIPMTPSALGRYERVANARPHRLKFESLKNVYRAF